MMGSTQTPTPTRPTSLGCTSSRFVSAPAAAATTGPTAPLPIPARRLAVGTRAAANTLAPSAPSTGSPVRAHVGTTASVHMVCLSAGYTLPGIGLRLARMERIVRGRCASSLTLHASSVFFLHRMILSIEVLAGRLILRPPILSIVAGIVVHCLLHPHCWTRPTSLHQCLHRSHRLSHQ